MQSYDEKLNLEVSIPRKLNYEWEPTIKIRIKDHECFALCDLGASVSMIPKTLCEGSMIFSLLQIEIWCP